MVSPDEVRRLLGDLEDETVAEILKLQPTLPDLEAAVVWLDGTLDQLARRGDSLSKATAGVLEIMLPDTEEDESDRNR